MERRKFLRGIVATGVSGSALAQQNRAPGVANKLPHVTDPGEMRGDMLYRKLGRTGETVSAIGLGGSHIGKPTLTDAESVKLIQSAIDRGITFMDNSWDYHEGRSERLMGKALSEGGYRNKVFLMSELPPIHAGRICPVQSGIG
ncbi:MAG: aldo/keto reductase [Acidobacteriota bacterium]|nr:aldo/keto reductase [Acidobacteriota bacterium]